MSISSTVCNTCRRVIGYRQKTFSPEGGAPEITLIKNGNYGECRTCGRPACTKCLKDGECEICQNPSAQPQTPIKHSKYANHVV